MRTGTLMFTLMVWGLLAWGVTDVREARAVERAEAEETARLLAKLIRAGRLVIDQNQAMIDDPHKGDKGFTPEVFEQQLIEEFRKDTSIDLRTLAAAPSSILILSCGPAFVDTFPCFARDGGSGVDGISQCEDCILAVTRVAPTAA